LARGASCFGQWRRLAAKAGVEEARAGVEEVQAGVEQGRVLAGEMSRGASVVVQEGRRPPGLWRRRRKEASVLSWRMRHREEV
jgi:hypothetical protein